MEFDTIVIGGSAAGLMCAIEAAKRKRKVAVIEKESALGKKILISGGGRCNFTNIHCTPSNYISENPHFCISTLSRYTPFHFIELVNKHKIAYHEKTLGQQFCDGSSRQIVGLLKKECEENGVQILLNSNILEVRKDKRFEVELPSNSLSSESLVVASGGLSIPKMGASDFGYRIAKQFGLDIVPCRPGLVPLTFEEELLKLYKPLSGTAFPVIVSCNGQDFKENLLFTHRGISGPAILQISSYWNKGDSINIDLLPDIKFVEALLEAKNNGEKAEFKTFLGKYISKKFSDTFCLNQGIMRPIYQYSEKELSRIATSLSNWALKPSGTEGYAKAEVTIGGVSTDELSSKTMEAKNVSGLFFIGEVVDVTGHLGGFNFQWAWASGHAAGQYC